MSTSPEENAIDQSLRDIFRDYDLPPDAHPRVWEGVADRIAKLPAPAKAMPYRFLLPLTAVVGIGIGWLLPHPASQQAHKAATIQAAPAVALPMPVLAAPMAAIAPPLHQVAIDVPAARIVARPRHSAHKQRTIQDDPMPTALPVSSGAVALADSTGATTAQAVSPALVVPTDSAPTVAATPPAQPTAAPVASAVPQQYAPSQTAKKLKPAGTDEKIGYRKLSQRQSEGKIEIRRWFSHFFQRVRHLLG